jgi:hypothetical protein
MGYAGISLKKFFLALSPPEFTARRREPPILGGQGRRTVHRESLVHFLIFCNVFSCRHRFEFAGPLTVMAGLVPVIHAAPVQMTSPSFAGFHFNSTNTWIADKPDHDAFRLRSPLRPSRRASGCAEDEPAVEGLGKIPATASSPTRALAAPLTPRERARQRPGSTSGQRRRHRFAPAPARRQVRRPVR